MSQHINLDELTSNEFYKLLTALVITRPISWVITSHREGETNAAPSSFFTYLDKILQSLLKGLNTRRMEPQNILNEFVVNLVSSDMLENMVESAASYAIDESEPNILGLSLTSSKKVKPPRLIDAPLAIECERKMYLSLKSERSILLVRFVVVFVKYGLIDTTTLHVAWVNDCLTAPLCADRYAEIGRIRRYAIPWPKRAHQKKE